MIQVTLSFPDKAAMLAYFADASLAVGPEKVATVKKSAPAPVAASNPQPVVKQESAPTTEAQPDPKPVASTDSSPKPSASVDYPTLQKAVFALAGKSREAAGAVAASMGVKTFKELPEDKWAEALAAVNVALGAA